MTKEERAVAEEIGQQIGQQIGEQIGQTVSQSIQKLLQTLGVATTGTSYQRAVEDIGETEVTAKELIKESGLRFSNEKRTYDEYQNVSLDAIGKNRGHFDKLVSDAQSHHAELDNALSLAVVNAVENMNMIAKNVIESANMVAKQAVRHGDIAIDRQWNVDEQNWAVVEILTKEALADMVSEAVAATTTKK